MVRKILTLMLISLSVPCFANFSESAPQGFHWYTSDTHIVMKEPKQEASITHTVTMAPHQ